MLAPGKHNWGPPRTSQVPDGALCSPPAALSGSPPGIRDGLPGDRHPWCRPTGGHGSQSPAGPSAQSHEAPGCVHGTGFHGPCQVHSSRKLSTPVQGRGSVLETREGRVLWLHMVGASPHFSPLGCCPWSRLPSPPAQGFPCRELPAPLPLPHPALRRGSLSAPPSSPGLSRPSSSPGKGHPGTRPPGAGQDLGHLLARRAPGREEAQPSGCRGGPAPQAGW